MIWQAFPTATLATILLATACAPGEPVPRYPTRLYCEMEDNCEKWSPEIIADIFDDFQKRWDVLFDEVPAMPADVFLQDHFWGVFDPVNDEGNVYTGHAEFDEVHVVGVLDGRVLEPWEAPLPHECTHNALRAETGDGDGDHADGEGPWNELHDLLIRTMRRDPDRDR